MSAQILTAVFRNVNLAVLMVPGYKPPARSVCQHCFSGSSSYEQTLSTRASDAAGYELERQVLNLHNDFQNVGTWQAVFTTEQINGWLAIHLNANFPGLLPPSIRDPRIVIDQGQAKLACRFDSRNISTVLSLFIEPYLTEQPNQLAIHISEARAGPLPLKSVLSRISRRAQRAKLKLRWAENNGVLVALVNSPAIDAALLPGARIRSFELRHGEIYLNGDVVPQEHRVEQDLAYPDSRMSTLASVSSSHQR